MSKKRQKNGDIIFSDYPDFRPNVTPAEIMEEGAFGGTYWRSIKSCVGDKKVLKNQHKKYPKSWWKGIPEDHLTREWEDYDKDINKYGVKVGQTYEAWCKSGWIHESAPYGWYNFYCNFYKGIRTEDDERQIKRWQGVRARFGNRLINMLKKKGKTAKDVGDVSPKIAQTLLHWGIEIKSHHLRD
uniref:Uncharacterized protein n=1 Tax=viral metagenome TaxID=1070528 RepID=A0A6C0LJI5_9ZZZZ